MTSRFNQATTDSVNARFEQPVDDRVTESGLGCLFLVLPAFLGAIAVRSAVGDSLPALVGTLSGAVVGLVAYLTLADH